MNLKRKGWVTFRGHIDTKTLNNSNYNYFVTKQFTCSIVLTGYFFIVLILWSLKDL